MDADEQERIREERDFIESEMDRLDAEMGEQEHRLARLQTRCTHPGCAATGKCPDCGCIPEFKGGE